MEQGYEKLQRMSIITEYEIRLIGTVVCRRRGGYRPPPFTTAACTSTMHHSQATTKWLIYYSLSTLLCTCHWYGVQCTFITDGQLGTARLGKDAPSAMEDYMFICRYERVRCDYTDQRFNKVNVSLAEESRARLGSVMF